VLSYIVTLPTRSGGCRGNYQEGATLSRASRHAGPPGEGEPSRNRLPNLDSVTQLSALKGDNVTVPSTHTPWYHGPTLMGYLETVEIEDAVQSGPFRMPVQWVNRPNSDFRGFSGRIVGGCVRPGDRVRVLPSGRESAVARVVTQDGDLDLAVAGQSITLTLADEIDISRGDMLSTADAPVEVADQFEATIIWMSEDPMLPGRPYLLKIGARTVGITIAAPKYRVNVNTLEHLAAKTLNLNEIGVCNLNLDQAIAFDSYKQNRAPAVSSSSTA